MTMPTTSQAQIEYPDSDGQPMAENTLQFRWILTIEGNLDALFADNPNVFVAGDLLWYPVEGQPTIRIAPDAMVVFGRPKGDRGSYRQWVEEGIAPQVVFEIQSPSNRPDELDRKFEFYDHYGVEEYYLYNPEDNELLGWRRQGGGLQPVVPMHGWVSPLLNIRFDRSEGELVLYGPDGQRFRTFVELMQEKEEAQQQRAEALRQADLDRQAREQAQRRADQERQRAEQERQRAEQAQRHADLESQRAEQERQAREETQKRAEALARRLRELGVDPEA